MAACALLKKMSDDWQVNQWLKKAVLLSFRLNDMTPKAAGQTARNGGIKVTSKFDGWDAEAFASSRVSRRAKLCCHGGGLISHPMLF